MHANNVLTRPITLHKVYSQYIRLDSTNSVILALNTTVIYPDTRQTK